MVDYSVCMLCYNDSSTLRDSLDSVLALSKLASIEVVVVDNASSDASPQILAEYERKGLVRHIEERCSRGRGRQIALEQSQGKYILAHMDCDDVFSPTGVHALIQEYHRDHEGMMLMTKKTTDDERSNITLGPVELFQSLGWRDINWFEDWDLWNRARAKGKYTFVKYPQTNPPHQRITVRIKRRRKFVSRNVMTFGRYRDMYRIGRPVFTKGNARLSQVMLFNLARAFVVVTGTKLPSVPDPYFDSNKD